MGIMSEIDIMRREGAREPEDFMAHGYNRKDAEAMSEVVKAAEKATVMRSLRKSGILWRRILRRVPNRHDS